MTKFKVGDKVVEKATGEVFYVTELLSTHDTGYTRLIYDCGRRKDGGGKWFYSFELDPYVEEKPTKKENCDDCKFGFKLGDRVKVVQVNWFVDRVLINKTGTICSLKSPNGGCVGVRFDEYDIMLHDCNKACESYHGWWLEPQNLKKIERSKESNPTPELKTGYFVQTRDESVFIVCEDVDGNKFLASLSDEYEAMDLANYGRDLLYTGEGSADDIMVVGIPTSMDCFDFLNANFDDSSYITVLWERKEEKQITKEEALKILNEKFGCEVTIK